MKPLFSCLALVAALSARIADAHDFGVTPEDWWLAWNLDPLVLLIGSALGWLYVRGLYRLWSRIGKGRMVSGWRASCCALGGFVLLFALLSPIDAMAEQLSSVHMLQHMLLMTIAAPLLAFAAPAAVLAWGMSEVWQEKDAMLCRTMFRAWNTCWLNHPLPATAMFAAVLWAWHHPRLYLAALRDPLIHDAQHLSFFIAAYFFWRAMIGSQNGRHANGLTAIPYLFTTSVHASALGVFLALSPRVWYEDYLGTTFAWGLTALEDQQLAGLIMWMPSCLIFPAAAAALLGRWLSRMTSTSCVRPAGARAQCEGLTA